jgi:hypothetical protein
LTVATLAPGEPAAINAERGFAVASDGNLAAVGARFDRPSGGGAVYLFAWDGSDWDEILTLTSDQVGEQLGISLEQFGISLGLHGNVLAVGAAGKQRDQGRPEGAVVVFTLTFESSEAGDRPAARIARVQKIASRPAGVSSLGRGIALDDHWLAVSATIPGADGDVGLVLAYPLPYVPGSTGDPVLPADPRQPGDRFGESLALSGGTLIVGAPGHQATTGQPSAGAVYRFRFATVGGWQQLPRLQAADAAADAQFGSAVAQSGTTLVVGAAGAAGTGAVHVFACGDTDCTPLPKPLVPASAAAGDHFGQAVAIYGDLLTAGAPLHAAAGMPGSGAAYVFQRDVNGVWSELPAASGPGAAAHALYGFAVAESAAAIVVGAPLAGGRAGAAYALTGGTHAAGAAGAKEPAGAAAPGTVNRVFRPVGGGPR